MPSLYLFTIVALLMPKFLWNRFRNIVQDYKKVADINLENRIRDLKKVL